MSQDEPIWSYEYEKEKKIKAGSLLLAEPFMEDENFKRAVVLICRHDEEGTHGLLLNKPVKLRLQDLVENFPIDFESQLMFGGPVGTDLIQILHNRGSMLEGSREVSDGVFWGGNFEQLKKYIRQGKITNQHVRFYLGYSGWEEGQLETEAKENSWIISNGANEAIFYSTTKEMWQKHLNKMGGVYRTMAGYPENPMLN